MTNHVQIFLISGMFFICAGCADTIIEPSKQFALGDALVSNDFQRASRLLGGLGTNIADVEDRYGRSPLYVAIAQGNPDAVDFILKHGGNPRKKERDGRTSLAWAFQKEKVDMLEIFVVNSVQFNSDEATACGMMSARANHGNEEVYRRLFDMGLKNKEDLLRISVDAASMDGNPSAMDALLNLGLNLREPIDLVRRAIRQRTTAILPYFGQNNHLRSGEVDDVLHILFQERVLDAKTYKTLVSQGGHLNASELSALGTAYYKSAKFDRAAYFLELAADSGNSQAQILLGYRNGKKPDASRISFKRRLAIKRAYETNN